MFHMPAIISKVDIITVGGIGVLHVGDTAFTTPKVAVKYHQGIGVFNTGGLIVSNNGVSSTNTILPHFIDQPIVSNE